VKELLLTANDVKGNNIAHKPQKVRLGASIVLSNMSTDFGDLKNRLKEAGLFSEIFEYDEKRADFFPELKKFYTDSGSRLINMVNRIIYTKKLGKAQIPFLPVDFRTYRDVYVYCDSDPIGYYLNYAKIPYHAIEDGLNCLVIFDAARYDNRGFFGLKAWMSARNLIFIQNGYGKYCLDMEVNNISLLANPGFNFIEQSREEMIYALDKNSLDTLLAIFITDIENLKQKLNAKSDMKQKVLILTEPLCDISTRIKVFGKIIDQYGRPNNKEATIIIKPHPMDTADYQKFFPGHIVLDSKFPMEMLNLIPYLYFNRVVSIFTVPSGIKFAGEVISLGRDYKDDPDDPLPFRQKLDRYIEELFIL